MTDDTAPQASDALLAEARVPKGTDLRRKIERVLHEHFCVCGNRRGDEGTTHGGFLEAITPIVEIVDAELRKAREEIERFNERQFPLQSSLDRMPWRLIELHRGQAFKNHGQTLERLAERHGLSALEAYAVMTDTDCFKLEKTMTEKEAADKLRALITADPLEKAESERDSLRADNDRLKYEYENMENYAKFTMDAAKTEIGSLREQVQRVRDLDKGCPYGGSIVLHPRYREDYRSNVVVPYKYILAALDSPEVKK